MSMDDLFLWHISLFWTLSLRPKIWSCQVTCDKHCKLEQAILLLVLLAVDLPPRPVLSFRGRTAPLTCYTPIRASAGRLPRRAEIFAGQIVTRTVRPHRTVTRTKCRGTICIFSSQIRNVADLWNDCRSCEPSTQNSTSALPQLSARSDFGSWGIWSYLFKLSWIRIQK
jgi:hypothetical protein